MDKQQAQDIIKNTLESSFDISSFIAFIKNLLNRIDDAPFTYQGNYIPDAYKQYIKKLQRIGKFTDGQNNIDILVITLQKETSLERARTMQRNFIAWYLNGSRGNVMKDAALAAFVSPDEADWRFSLVKMDYKFEQTKTGKMKVKEEFTPARRWSFLVGANEGSHTAQSRLVGILANDEQAPNLKELENAFDIETVTKEFFLKYRQLFLRTKEELDKVIENDPKIKADFESNGVDTVNFAKKLLGQIVFLYFLQKKGWFGVGRDNDWGTGSKHFLRELFAKKHGDYKNFFNDILEPLFYEALRIDRSHDDGYYSWFDCKIPFLNGGLFDPIGNYDWVHTDIIIPDSLFSNKVKTKEGDTGDGILDIFDRFNFTVKEDEPLEKEVAIDPELLGKAYEKFNAIRPDNFESYQNALKSGRRGEESKFNKKFGVYYTPREIVHYMCQQSLINYLATELEGKIKKDDIETLIHIGEHVSENEQTALIKEQSIKEGQQKTSDYKLQLPESIRTNAKQIDDKLADITVCDPAVGSGAFPVGMMSEIVRVRNVLSTFVQDNSRTPYEFKRRCIEHSLYGVDIDPGAVEIAKLRLWLSLVVDEDDINNIKPLPNLDYKVVCGNSLLGYPYTPAGLEGIEQLKEQFFKEVNPTQKNELRTQIDNAIYGLFKNSEKSIGYKVTMDFKINFSEVFHHKGGFDVVIANPPYLGEKGHKEVFRETKRGPLGRFYQGKMDVFYFFFHLALDIGKQNSNIAFITTNYYPTATGANKLRQDFKKRSILKYLINFNELRIFESALGQHNMITILEKSHNAKAIAKTCISQRHGIATAEVLQQIVNGNDTETQYSYRSQKNLYDGEKYYIRLLGNSDDPVQTMLDKIKKEGVELNTICNINQGILTGADKVSRKHIQQYAVNSQVGDGIFVLNNGKVEELNLSVGEMKVLRPWFKNSDINRWNTSLCASEQVIYSNYNTIDTIENFPDIENHLKKYKKIISQYSYRWHDLHRSRETEIFESSKIVAPQRSPQNTFGYNRIPWYAASDVFFITQKDKSVQLKYILALINSKLYYLWLYHRGKRKGETLELIAKPLSEIPIKKISDEDQSPFIAIVDKILNITKDDDYRESPSRQARVKELEKQIDQLVYKLYSLTKAEIDIIKNSGN